MYNEKKRGGKKFTYKNKKLNRCEFMMVQEH